MGLTLGKRKVPKRRTIASRIYVRDKAFKKKSAAQARAASWKSQNIAAQIRKEGKKWVVWRSVTHTVGTLQWGSYMPGKRRLYQLQQVTNKHGGVSERSYWMTSEEVKAFVNGYNRAKGRKGKRLPLPFKRRR